MKLQRGEKIIYELCPDSKVLVIWFFTKCLPLAFFGALLIFWIFAFSWSIFCIATERNSAWSFASAGIMAAAMALTFLILGIIYCRFLRKTYVYYITNQRCVFHGGIIRRIERSVPYHKITDVEASQNIIERMLGISSVNIFTPGTASMMAVPFGGQRAEISFVGLKDNEAPAEAINKILRKYRSTGE